MISKCIAFVIFVVSPSANKQSGCQLVLSSGRRHYTHDIENNVCTRVANCLCAHERVILVLYCNEGNKHQNNT